VCVHSIRCLFIATLCVALAGGRLLFIHLRQQAIAAGGRGTLGGGRGLWFARLTGCFGTLAGGCRSLTGRVGARGSFFLGIVLVFADQRQLLFYKFFLVFFVVFGNLRVGHIGTGSLH